ncbi:unnamed protein product, partial [Discosporangium mesarthrocarpum]
GLWVGQVNRGVGEGKELEEHVRVGERRRVDLAPGLFSSGIMESGAISCEEAALGIGTTEEEGTGRVGDGSDSRMEGRSRTPSISGGNSDAPPGPPMLTRFEPGGVLTESNMGVNDSDIDTTREQGSRVSSEQEETRRMRFIVRFGQHMGEGIFDNGVGPDEIVSHIDLSNMGNVSVDSSSDSGTGGNAGIEGVFSDMSLRRTQLSPEGRPRLVEHAVPLGALEQELSPENSYLSPSEQGLAQGQVSPGWAPSREGAELVQSGSGIPGAVEEEESKTEA